MAHLQNLEGHQMEGKLPMARLSSQPFEVVSPYEPAGDQPKAIAQLAKNIESGMRYETLLGVRVKPIPWLKLSRRYKNQHSF